MVVANRLLIFLIIAEWFRFSFFLTTAFSILLIATKHAGKLLLEMSAVPAFARINAFIVVTGRAGAAATSAAATTAATTAWGIFVVTTGVDFLLATIASLLSGRGFAVLVCKFMHGVELVSENIKSTQNLTSRQSFFVLVYQWLGLHLDKIQFLDPQKYNQLITSKQFSFDIFFSTYMRTGNYATDYAVFYFIFRCK